MTGTVQGYAWGSTTVLPALLGVDPDGTPQAELWFGAHPSASSRVGAAALDQLVDTDPVGTIGARSVDQFGPRLPYLLKVLAADRPLSLQAHPTRAQAEAGFAREGAAGLAPGSPDRVFADDWPKPEMMVALTPVEALCGFREPAETYALFRRLDVPEVQRLVEPLTAGSLETVVSTVLRLDGPERPLVARLVDAAHRMRSADRDVQQFADTATLLNRYFPGDPGIIAALLLNRIRLAPGDALYLPAGNMHAYLGGSGIEVMANSDNTLRGGLTDKLIAVDALLDVLDFTSGQPPLVTATQDAPGLWRYATPAPEFALWRIEPDGRAVSVPAADAGRIVLVADGPLSLVERRSTCELDRGRAAFCFPGDEVQVSGRGTAFVAGPGL